MKNETPNINEDVDKLVWTYRIKRVSRNNSALQEPRKGEKGKKMKRKETVAEHVASSIRLAIYFLHLPEFRTLDAIRIFMRLSYHDDAEIITKDASIDDPERDQHKEKEDEAIGILCRKYPTVIAKILKSTHQEWSHSSDPEIQFCHAIDKMDALIHELQFPDDWGKKWWTEEKVRQLFQPSFQYSQTFMQFFEAIIRKLNSEGYFNT